MADMQRGLARQECGEAGHEEVRGQLTIAALRRAAAAAADLDDPEVMVHAWSCGRP